jgi:hypothetical protein
MDAPIQPCTSGSSGRINVFLVKLSVIPRRDGKAMPVVPMIFWASVCGPSALRKEVTSRFLILAGEFVQVNGQRAPAAKRTAARFSAQEHFDFLGFLGCRCADQWS